MFRRLSLAAVLVGGNVSADTAGLYRYLEPSELRIVRSAVQEALEKRTKGEAQHWSIPGFARGSVIPRRTWRSRSGHWCREYQEIIEMADGRRQSTIVVRCRSSDGRWRKQGS